MEVAERATVHGFRSAFKVWAAEVAKARDEVSGGARPCHSREGTAAYLRTDFLEERRQLMTDWATFNAEKGE